MRTVYDLVQQLRPRWLTNRGPDSFRSVGGAVIYLDGARLGSVSQLRDISCASVLEIRHFDAVAATQVYGTGHRGGAILVVSRPGS